MKRLLLMVMAAACGDDGMTPRDAAVDTVGVDGGGPGGWVAEHVGASTGFVSAVAFAPMTGTVWISGDDASGLYRSTDGGASLAPVSSSPLDWSTYGWAFSSDGQRVVAPSHFGRGLAQSLDGGVTWQVLTGGLPQGAGDARRLNDVEMLASGDLLLATGSGLYRTSGGAGSTTFAKITDAALGTSTHYTQLVKTSAGYLAGTNTGRLYGSTDGASWSELTSADGAGITDLAVGRLGTYVASANGLVVRLPLNGGPEVIANPAVDTRFVTALWTKLAVAPYGTTTDRIYVGIVGNLAGRGEGKLLVSSDGGATFQTRAAELAGASIFSIAIDPANVERAVIGTVGEGAFVTADAGTTWTATTGDLRATAALGFAVDPAQPDHLLVASSENLPGTPCLLERAPDTGAWTRRTTLDADARSLMFDGAAVFAGGFADPSVRRSGNGTSGPFATDPGVAGEVVRFSSTSKGIYAAGAVIAHRGAGGWTVVRSSIANQVIEEPSGAIVSCGVGILRSSSGDFTDAVELMAPALPWFDCAADPNGALLATGDGQLWVASDPTLATGAAGWHQVTTPLDGVALLSVLTAGSTWIIGGGELDAGASFSSSSRSGVYASDDAGATWVSLGATMWPSHTVYQLHRGRDANEAYVGLWGGGLWRLTR